MSIHLRVPGAPLGNYVERLWYYVDFQPDHAREHVLPEGTFEIIINLQETPRRLFDPEDSTRHDSFKRAWWSGTHAGYLVIDALASSSMIGAHFKPGGAAPFLEFPASELHEQVVELDALWGGRADEWREQLLAANGPQAKLALLERLLLDQLAAARGEAIGGQGITWALNRFIEEPHLQNIRAVSHSLGVSHKHFIDQFRRRVGMPPKLFCRVRRFQRVLGQIQFSRKVDWADVACSCGYFDQAHFANDFMAFAGVNPSRYLVERLEGDANFVRATAPV